LRLTISPTISPNTPPSSPLAGWWSTSSPARGPGFEVLLPKQGGAGGRSTSSPAKGAGRWASTKFCMVLVSAPWLGEKISNLPEIRWGKVPQSRWGTNITRVDCWVNVMKFRHMCAGLSP
jgi:hypothetical protein